MERKLSEIPEGKKREPYKKQHNQDIASCQRREFKKHETDRPMLLDDDAVSLQFKICMIKSTGTQVRRVIGSSLLIHHTSYPLEQENQFESLPGQKLLILAELTKVHQKQAS